MSDSVKSDTKSDEMFEPLRRGPQHIRNIISRVLTLEKERLYQSKPHLNDDVIRIIKEEVR